MSNRAKSHLFVKKSFWLFSGCDKLTFCQLFCSHQCLLSRPNTEVFNLNLSFGFSSAPSTLRWKKLRAVRLGLLVHTNPSWKQRFSNRKNLKTAAFRCRVDGNHIESGAFRKVYVKIIMWFPWPSVSQTEIQNVRWLLCLQFKFLWCSVNGALISIILVYT